MRPKTDARRNVRILVAVAAVETTSAMNRYRAVHLRPNFLNKVDEDDDSNFVERVVDLKTNKWVSDEYAVLEFLGRGRFGEVKKCRERKTGKVAAAKFIGAQTRGEQESVKQEIDVMKMLQHPRILQLFDAYHNSDKFCLVTELVEGGELFDRIVADEFDLTERQCIQFTRQICEGVQYIHSLNIVHLDLKPENILCVSKSGTRIKIIDFGLAHQLKRGEIYKTLVGTAEFVSPEVVNYDGVSFSTDMWSVGVIVYVIVSGLSPFLGDNDQETLCNISKGDFTFEDEEFNEVSSNCKNFISKLLLRNPSKRMTASECLVQPWLQRSFKWTRCQRSLNQSKKKLKKFVMRRKWQKAVNAMLALERMGVDLSSATRRNSLS